MVRKRGRQEWLLDDWQPDDAQRLEALRKLVQGMPHELWQLGQEWYPMQLARCQQWARETGYSTEQCAAVLAVFSVRKLWNGNLAAARRVLFEGEFSGLSQCVAKARAILALDPARADTAAIRPYLGKGSKVPNFYGSTLLYDCCACDMHIFAACGLEQKEANYGRCERLIRTLAAEFGIPARDMQAIIWLAHVATLGRNLASYHPAGKRRAK